MNVFTDIRRQIGYTVLTIFKISTVYVNYIHEIMSQEQFRPKKRAAVQILMSKLLDVFCDVTPKKGRMNRLNVPHFVFSCPLGEECKKTDRAKFEK
eukprot:IDg3310t1